jgi:hypothetical protein
MAALNRRFGDTFIIRGWGDAVCLLQELHAQNRTRAAYGLHYLVLPVPFDLTVVT